MQWKPQCVLSNKATPPHKIIFKKTETFAGHVIPNILHKKSTELYDLFGTSWDFLRYDLGGACLFVSFPFFCANTSNIKNDHFWPTQSVMSSHESPFLALSPLQMLEITSKHWIFLLLKQQIQMIVQPWRSLNAWYHAYLLKDNKLNVPVVTSSRSCSDGVFFSQCPCQQWRTWMFTMRPQAPWGWDGRRWTVLQATCFCTDPSTPPRLSWRGR